VTVKQNGAKPQTFTRTDEVAAAIRRGLEDIEAGRVVPRGCHEESERRSNALRSQEPRSPDFRA
jgi:predicted transcriptional regulator